MVGRLVTVPPASQRGKSDLRLIRMTTTSQDSSSWHISSTHLPIEDGSKYRKGDFHKDLRRQDFIVVFFYSLFVKALLFQLSYDTVPWCRMSGGLFVSSRFLPLRVWSFDNCCLMVICYIINNYETIAYF